METLEEMIRNEDIHNKIGVVPVEEKMREIRVRRFSHMQRRPRNALVR